MHWCSQPAVARSISGKLVIFSHIFLSCLFNSIDLTSIFSSIFTWWKRPLPHKPGWTLNLWWYIVRRFCKYMSLPLRQKLNQSMKVFYLYPRRSERVTSSIVERLISYYRTNFIGRRFNRWLVRVSTNSSIFNFGFVLGAVCKRRNRRNVSIL